MESESLGELIEPIHLLQEITNSKEKSGFTHSFEGGPENVERLLDMVREDGKLLEGYARKLSKERKRPVVVICNARAGTCLYFPLNRSSAEIVNPEQRKAFAEKVWKQKTRKRKGLFSPGKQSTLLSLLKAAAKEMEEGTMDSFVHPLKRMKISSYHRESYGQELVAEPFDIDSIIASGVADIIFADYSTSEAPGSFGLSNRTDHKGGFVGWIADVRPRMKVVTGSRSPYASTSPEEALKKLKGKRGPVALMINMLKNSEVYSLVDNHPEILGEFGYEMGNDHDDELEFKPIFVETTRGTMQLPDFVRQYLRQ